MLTCASQSENPDNRASTGLECQRSDHDGRHVRVPDLHLPALVFDRDLLRREAQFETFLRSPVGHRMCVDRLRPALEHHRRIPLAGRCRLAERIAAAVLRGRRRRVRAETEDAAPGLRVVGAEPDRDGAVWRRRGGGGAGGQQQRKARGGNRGDGGRRTSARRCRDRVEFAHGLHPQNLRFMPRTRSFDDLLTRGSTSPNAVLLGMPSGAGPFRPNITRPSPL